jgi:L-lactate dehydrogenase (cytochrome)
MLPPIVQTTGDQVEVLFDSGIHSGKGIVRAIALGAHACLNGQSSTIPWS